MKKRIQNNRFETTKKGVKMWRELGRKGPLYIYCPKYELNDIKKYLKKYFPDVPIKFYVDMYDDFPQPDYFWKPSERIVDDELNWLRFCG